MTIEQQKTALRTEMLHRCASLSQTERAEQSRAINERLTQFITPDHTIIAAFFPLPTEPDILPFLHSQFADNKVIALPHWQTGEKHMHFYAVNDWSELKTGEFGIVQPSPDVGIDPKTIDVALIPGLAFDAAGHRLGRGQGFYDRFLTQLLPKTQTIGICFDFQIISSVPRTLHDQFIQYVVTPKNIYARNNTKLSISSRTRRT